MSITVPAPYPALAVGIDCPLRVLDLDGTRLPDELLDPHLTDPLKQTAGPVRFQGIPITLYVDAEGVIAYRAIGGIASTEQMLKDADTFLGVRL